VFKLINFATELKNYKPIDINNLKDSCSYLPQNVRKSIEYYNEALEKIKIGSEDIAIIELKKAISINPDFYEAVNLLGLCYCLINDYKMAAETFQMVVKAENNCLKALEYIEVLSCYDEVACTLDSNVTRFLPSNGKKRRKNSKDKGSFMSKFFKKEVKTK